MKKKYFTSKNYRDFVIDFESNLADYATRSENARHVNGSKIDLNQYGFESEGFRTPFQIDRDKIMYSKYFPLLAHKTQIFIAPESVHYRTRLIHTLLVSSIAKTISRALGLNEDLTEAIAIGHDLGHTPFGHKCEDSLNTILFKNKNINYKKYEKAKKRLKDEFSTEEINALQKEYYCQENDKRIFSHPYQSFRLLSILGSKEITGHTAFGIMNHSRNFLKEEIDDNQFNLNFNIIVEYDRAVLKEKYNSGTARKTWEININGEYHKSIEAEVVRVSDNIAWMLHDLDDGIRAGFVSPKDIKARFPQKFEYYLEDILGVNRYGFLINKIVEANKNQNEDYKRLILPKEEVIGILKILGKKIRKYIHNDKRIKIKNRESQRYIELFFKYFKRNIDYLRTTTPEINNKFYKKDGKEIILKYDRLFCDFISLHTDQELIRMYEEIFSPKFSE